MIRAHLHVLRSLQETSLAEPAGTSDCTFTDNGELLSRTDTATNDVTEYAYDAVGNLRAVVLPNGDEIEYLVDGQGRRVGKLVNGVFEQGWLWKGQLQPVAELDGSGAVAKRFVYGGGVNAPELMVTAAGTYRLVKDQLGSVRFVIDVATGAVVQELAYDAWGRVVLDTSPGLQPFGFAGGLYEPETGLVRFGVRDYDSETGRWTAKDPVRFDGGINLYEYAGSSPIALVDPTGRVAWAAPLGWAFTLGGGGALAGAAAFGATAAGAAAVFYVGVARPHEIGDYDCGGTCAPSSPIVDVPTEDVVPCTSDFPEDPDFEKCRPGARTPPIQECCEILCEGSYGPPPSGYPLIPPYPTHPWTQCMSRCKGHFGQ